MNKAVLSNRIFLSKTSELFANLKKELTYIIPQNLPEAPPLIICDITKINNNILSIPIGRIDLIPADYEIIDKRTSIPAKFNNPTFTLREDQQEVYNQVTDSCIINAQPGWGKTYTTLAIAEKLKQKTLIIVHTVALRDQWKKEIEKTLNIVPGIIGSGKKEIDKLIVIANIQTLRKCVPEVANKFGLVIGDEIHHLPSTSFKNIIDKIKARYKIGLSATLIRKDKKHPLIKDYISTNIIIPRVNNEMIPSILAVESNIPLNAKLNIPWANTVNELTTREDYKKLIINLAKANAAIGHFVLVVSDRTEFLEYCSSMTENSVCVTGTTQNREELYKRLNYDCNILYGAISIYKEGIDIPKLSCVILAAPIGNNEALLKQIIGRVTRPCENKLDPIVVDIILSGNTAKRQFSSRLGYYIQKGYKIKTI